MKLIIKYKFFVFWFIVYAVTASVCYIIDRKDKDALDKTAIVNKVEHLLNNRLDLVTSLPVVNNYNKYHLQEQQIHTWGYKGDSLFFWNDELMNAMSKYDIDALPNFAPIKINNAYGTIFKKVQDDTTIVFFIQIASYYENLNYSNQFQSELYANKIVGDNFIISLSQIENYKPIYINKSNKPIFYLSLDDNLYANHIPSMVMLICYLIMTYSFAIAVGYFIYYYILYKQKKYITFIVLLKLFIIINVFLRVSVYSELPYNMANSPFLSPALLGSTMLEASVGDMLYFTVAGLIILWLFNKELNNVKTLKFTNIKIFDITIGLSLAFVAIAIIFIIVLNAIRFLFTDNSLNFNISNIFEIDIYLFVCVVVLLLLVIAIILLISISSRLIDANIPNRRTGILLVVIFITVAALINYIYLADRLSLSNGILIFMLYLIYKKFPTFFLNLHQNNQESLSLSTYVWILSICIVAAIQNQNYSIYKEKEIRKSFAFKLTNTELANLEINFSQLAHLIKNDTTLSQKIKAVNDTSISTLKAQIIDSFFQKYFHNYNASVLIFNANKTLIEEEFSQQDYNEFSPKILTRLLDSASEKSLLLDSNLNYNNLGIASVNNAHSNKVENYIVFKFQFNRYYYESGIGQFENPSMSKFFKKYQFGFYSNNHLGFSNTFKLPFVHDSLRINKEFTFNDSWNNSRMFYRLSPSNYLIIDNPQNNIYIFISFFGIAMLITFSTHIALFFISYFSTFISKKIHNEGSKIVPLSTKINLGILSTVLISLILVGLITVTFVINNFNNTKKKQLNDYLENFHHLLKSAILSEHQQQLENFMSIHKSLDTTEIRNVLVKSRRENLSPPVRFYGPNGKLIAEDNSMLRASNLTNNIMNPDAFHKLKSGLLNGFVQNEYFGNMRYLSAYTVLFDDNNNAIGYLNMPYYTTYFALKLDISNIIITLINAYAIIFIISGLISIGISKSLVRSYNLLIEKFKSVKIHGNVPIKWDADNELGVLVNEYNLMIERVEKMVQQLAHNERELGWRDIAKQVAHEIKNPLTPMKLQLQYLELAIKNKRNDVDILIHETTNSLLQQIENLNVIATEFSNFVKLPKPYFELIKIDEFISSIVDLYKYNERTTIFKTSKHYPEDTLLTLIDRSYLTRVLNNLILNAQQAIPNDRQGEIIVELSCENGYAIIEMSDNGTGISADKLNQIFVPHFTTKSSGTGIGLAMTKAMVVNMEGEISVESKEGIGTTFKVKLPLINLDISQSNHNTHQRT